MRQWESRSVESSNNNNRADPQRMAGLYLLFPFQRSCFLARHPVGALMSVVVRILNSSKVSEQIVKSWPRYNTQHANTCLYDLQVAKDLQVHVSPD